jgi:cobalt/nickel transport system permease protein
MVAFASLDAYVYHHSWIHQWQPRLKLVSLLALMFAFATVKQWVLLPPMLATTAVFYGLSRLPWKFLKQRLSYPGLFILAVVVVLPLTAGQTVLWQWGWVSLRQEGLVAMLLVVSRFLSILTIGFILLGTTPFLTIIQTMRSLGLPVLLTDMTLLAYRYLYEIADTLATMQQSMRLRGFGYGRQRWLRVNGAMVQQLATLTGTLLIRSYERSERVYKAMRLRGYGQRAKPTVAQTHQPQRDRRSVGLTVITLAIAGGFVLAEIGLSTL